MIGIDGLLTVTTWLPYNLYLAITASYGLEFFTMYSIQTVLIVEAILKGIMFTNAFSAPVVFFIFNSHFRVNILFIQDEQSHFSLK